MTMAGGRRVPALDFTKGMLVLIMVLYHWLNYFVGFDHEFYRYLRFLTPSFIFITGFLISNAYLSRYSASDIGLRRRLVQRGLKLLGLFVVLNLLASTIRPVNAVSFESLAGTIITGEVLLTTAGKGASFYVLVPIAHLLLLSALLLWMGTFFRHVFLVTLFSFLLAIVILDLNGLQSPNLELVAIGILGIVCGEIPLTTIDRLGRHWILLIIAYICYVAAIAVWDVRYYLQIIGVCLSLSILYLLGIERGEPGVLRKQLVLVGKYSLFAYIAQIAILQVLRRGLRHVALEPLTLTISFLMALGLTVLAVLILDRLRARAQTINRLYGAVFS